MPNCVILRGIPGSGKSHYVKQHKFEESGYVICSADNFFMEGGIYRFDPTKIGEAHSFCMSKFIHSVYDGVNVIVDNTNIHKWEFINYVYLATKLNYTIDIVEFPVCTKFQLLHCIERQTHEVPKDVVLRMFAEFERTPAGSWDIHVTDFVFVPGLTSDGNSV